MQPIYEIRFSPFPSDPKRVFSHHCVFTSPHFHADSTRGPGSQHYFSSFFSQINKLTVMGFTDLEKCKQALVTTNGDVMAAIEFLVVHVVGVVADDLCSFVGLSA